MYVYYVKYGFPQNALLKISLISQGHYTIIKL